MRILSPRQLHALFLLATFFAFNASPSIAQAKLPAVVPNDLPIFPGAEGFGTTTVAGSGRHLDPAQTTVFKVTNLNASGSGSLRACTDASGPRVCIFEVSGTIRLTSELKVKNPYITIAGQTAPSPGITLRGAGLRITTHDVLVQHIRIRVGDDPNGPNPENRDGLGINGQSGVYNIVVDHISVSWSIDENLTLYYSGVQDVTIRNSIVSEALHNSLHPKGGHSMGMLLGGDGNGSPSRASIFQNLIAHNNARNLQFSGAPNASLVFANNLVYNWGNYGTRLRNGGDASAVGNVYLPGSNSGGSRDALIVLDGPGFQVYLNDIRVDGASPLDAWGIVNGDANPRVDTPPIWVDGFTPMSSALVENYVLDNAGARPADRDSVDTRVIQSVRDGTGQIIDTPSDVGGWPDLAENRRTLTIPENPNGDDDGDGYTNLEEWLHAFAAQVEGKTPSTTFADVPLNHWAHGEIEALYQAGYTAGCSTDPLMYCPDAAMTRAESAVFVVRGINGAAYVPPDPSAKIFDDVPLSEWFSKWSTALWNAGYTAGCGTNPLFYCPLQEHTRTEGTVFFLRMLNGPDFIPPDPTGIFADVSTNFWGTKWIEAAYNAALIPACQTDTQLLFCPDDPLDRAMAAHMMVQAKGLKIP